MKFQQVVTLGVLLTIFLSVYLYYSVRRYMTLLKE